jgi:putative phage-type endonuclease
MLTEVQASQLNKGIGASECGAVLGIDPYCTPYELWMIKTGRMIKDVQNEEAVIMGNLLEPVIAKRYAQKTNQRVARVNNAYLHKQFPHMLCHVDRKIVGKRKIVEIKTANPFSTMWGEEGTDEVPAHYIAQVQHQLACTGFEESDLIVFRGTTDLRIYNFKPDYDLISLITEKVDHFWNHHILKDVAPPATNRADLKHMFPTNNGNFIEITDEVTMHIEKLSSIKETIKKYEGYKSDIEKLIIEFIADNDGIKSQDEIIATFKANKNGTRSLRIK